MNRRDLLAAAIAASARAIPLTRNTRAEPWREAEHDGTGKIWTVRGPIEPKELGLCLPHEHIMVDFIGAAEASPDRYDVNNVLSVVFPFLAQLGELGAKSLVECTPAHLGRDPKLLARLSEGTGLHLLTNTGYYAANGGKHLPDHARKETAEQIAARWLREWTEGIDDTGIRPGFIKISVGNGPLAAVERTLVRAAARVHRESGLTIASHTGGGRAALEQLDILKQEGVNGSAFIWVHAQTERDASQHVEAAARGAFVEFDGITSDANVIKFHVGLINAMRRRGKLDRVLISHDAGWYHVGQPNGGEFRSYEPLFANFLPALREGGYQQEDLDMLTIDNPREAFTIRRRPLR